MAGPQHRKAIAAAGLEAGSRNRGQMIVPIPARGRTATSAGQAGFGRAGRVRPEPLRKSESEDGPCASATLPSAGRLKPLRAAAPGPRPGP